jgi:hypothetical protein
LYPVSIDYKNKIQELDRVFGIEIRVEHSTGTLNLTDKDIELGSFIYRDGSQAGDEFTVGGTVASDIEFTLVNKEEYENINFIGAKVIPTIKLLMREGSEGHFIQPTQPSKMLGAEEEWEYVPMGQFNIDIADRTRSTVKLKGIDNMIFLDKPYSLSALSYPATLYQIYTNICGIADVGIGTLNFVNQGYMVNERPKGDLTLRNVLGFVAELSGNFAKFNRTGGLELRWYENTGVTITSKHRSNLEMGDFTVNLTGIGVDSDEKDGNDKIIYYMVGTEEYAIDLTGNELLQGGYEDVLPPILTRIEGTSFRPYTASFQGDPALESGDIVTQIDIDGKTHTSVITHLSYKYRGTSQFDGKGLPNISRGFQSTDNRIPSIIDRIEQEVGDALTNLEEAQLRATELIANTLGGYSTKESDAFYIHDGLTLATSTKIWKWGLGGFGYSDDGGLTYGTGITAEGSIVANLINAGIVTAENIKTGMLESQDGGTWINMDNGEFNFQNKVRFVDGQFHLQLEATDIDDIITDISPYNIILSNEYQGFTTENNGVPLSPVVIETNIGVYRGSVRVDAIIQVVDVLNSSGVPITVGTVTKSNPTSSADGFVKWSLNAGQIINSDDGWLDIYILINGESYNKKVKWSKNKVGKDGSDGEYVHIRYSQNANGSPMTPIATNAKYLGIVANNNPTPPTLNTEYKWTQIKGQDGIVANILPTATHFVSTTNDINPANYIYTPSMIKLNFELQNCEYRAWQYSLNGTTWYNVTSGSNGLTINTNNKSLDIANTSPLYNTVNTVYFKLLTNEIGTTTLSPASDIQGIQRIYDSTVLSTRVVENKSLIEQSNTAWSARFDSTIKTGKIRYIRDWLNGSSSYTTNWWSELEIYDGNGVKQSLSSFVAIFGGSVTASAVVNPSYPLSNWYNGSYSSRVQLNTQGWQYLQFDFGMVIEVPIEIGIRHYGQNQKWNHKLEVSEDGINWRNLYDSNVDGTYPEPASTKRYKLGISVDNVITGITTIDGTGVKVEHTSFPGQYSKMQANGFFRQYPYGQGAYLNDIFVEENIVSYNRGISPILVKIELPLRFKDRQSTTKIILGAKDFSVKYLMDAQETYTINYTEDIEMVLRVYDSNWTTLQYPTLWVYAYMVNKERDTRQGTTKYWYHPMKFFLMAIGI